MEDQQAVDVDEQTDDIDSVDDTLQDQGTDQEGTEVDEDGNGSDTAAHEVFVGGLPPDAVDEDVKQAFEVAGEVLSVRLNRRKKTGECKGFGFVRFADPETAERATAEVKQVCGRVVGVYISRGRAGDQFAPNSSPGLEDDPDPDSSINKLLSLLRSHSNMQLAVNAALKAVMKLPQRPKPSDAADFRGADDSSSQHELERVGSGGLGLEGHRGRRDDDLPLPDPSTFLDSYPKCRHLVETFRANPNTHNKTPLAILHEYATRLNLELTYMESATSNLGPFTVEAKLSSVGGAVTYATGTGRGRGKKDAKQVGAAAVLEMLLCTVPEGAFLQPGKAKQAKVAAGGEWTGLGPLGPAGGRISGQGRGMMGGRRSSRGRNTWAAQRPARPDGFYSPMHSKIPLEYQNSGPWYGGSGGSDFGGRSGVDFMSLQPFDGGPSQKREYGSTSQDPNMMRGQVMHGLNAFEQLNSVNSSPYPRSGLGQPQGAYTQDELHLYAQSGNYGLGGMGTDVSGLSRNSAADSLGMRPTLSTAPLGSVGLGMQFNPAVTAGLRDAALGQLGSALADPSLQLSQQGQYGLPRQMPY